MGLIDSFIQFLTFSHIMVVVYVLNTIIALGLIFIDNKSPTATMAWIMILYIMPLFGLILYLILSQNIARQKIFRMTENEQQNIDEISKWQHDAVRNYATTGNNVAHKWRDLITMNIDYAGALLTDNSSVETIFDGKEMFSRLCDDIRNAKYSIKVCYFIVKDDSVGNEFISLLTQKASEGVRVRLMIDALGSRSIGYTNLKAFKEAGGQYAYFFKPIIRHLFFRINYRNHRKIVIIDNEIGYIGGFNIAREYLGLKKKFGYWRDTQLIIRGNALVTLNTRFYMDWRYASRESIDLLEQSARYALKPDSGNIPIQIVSSGPESDKEEIKRAQMKMINDAVKSIYIQTPYLVPDEPMMESLAIAARSGVDVRIMIPSMPDHPFVYRTTLYNAGKLIKEGARIFIYENGFLHAKTMTVDGEVCTAGSSNFDIRSFRLNFEANAFIYDIPTTAKMNAQFEKDLEYCREYTAYDREHIGMIERAAESISRLLTEIL